MYDARMIRIMSFYWAYFRRINGPTRVKGAEVLEEIACTSM